MAILNKKFDESKTYRAYSSGNVFKCDEKNLKSTINKVKTMNQDEKILIELPDTTLITDEILEILPENVDVRVIGGLTKEYSKSHNNGYLDFLREKATYSKGELRIIMNKIKSIESNIDKNWNDYEKALYLYEYLKLNFVYRTPSSLDLDGNPLDKNGDIYRTRTWDSLIGIITEVSTCSGFAHIYQELCKRQGIECFKVSGKYKVINEHAWNLIEIDGKDFIVDVIWDTKDYEKGINHTTNFCNGDYTKYVPRCYEDKFHNLAKIDEKWMELTSDKVSINIPREHLEEEKVKKFLKIRELDRERMIKLRGGTKEMIKNPTQKIHLEDSLER